MAVVVVLLFVGCVLVVIWALQGNRSTVVGQSEPEAETGPTELKRRYAAGGITKSEYDQALRALGVTAEAEGVTQASTSR